MLPLYFISGVFVAVSTLPHWIVDVAAIFPVRHLAAALLTAYNPHTHGAGLAPHGPARSSPLGARADCVIALRRFSWLPLGS